MFSIKSAAASWEKFFFEKKSVEGLAVFRIVWFSLLFCYYLLDIGNVGDFYGPHAILSQDTVRGQFQYIHANLFYLFRPSYEITYALFIVYGLSLLTSLLGLFTRTSIFTAIMLMATFHQRNIWLLSSSEVLMRIIIILLFFSSCGHALSVDSLLGRKYAHFRKEQEAPVWPLRLIQIQLSVVYLVTVWQKLKGGDWFDGTAVYYATRIESMTNFSVPFFLDSLPFLKLMTWATLFVETALGTLIWFKEFRRPVIAAGILFHLGIEYVMSIPFFELIMVALLINFFTPEEHRAFVMRIKEYVLRGIQESSLTPKTKERISFAFRS